MTNTEQTTVTSGSVNVWVRTGSVAKFTGFMSLGSKKAILSWDVRKKTVSLHEVDKNNKAGNALFSVDVQSITRATFLRGKDFFIRVNNGRYDLSLRDIRANSTAAMDALQVVEAGDISSYMELSSNIGALRAFLSKENPKSTYASRVSSRTYLVIIGVVTAAVVVVLIIAYVVGRAHSPINSFQDCANAGYPIQQSYPEVCSVPNGKSFIDN